VTSPNFTRPVRLEYRNLCLNPETLLDSGILDSGQFENFCWDLATLLDFSRQDWLEFGDGGRTSLDSNDGCRILFYAVVDFFRTSQN
jgi:hypothetical protein